MDKKEEIVAKYNRLLAQLTNMLDDEKYQQSCFAVGIKTNDIAVLACLRALAFNSEEGDFRQIAYGGATSAMVNKTADFHFASPEKRKLFLDDAARLLPLNSWEKIYEDDNKPAKRQRKKR